MDDRLGSLLWALRHDAEQTAERVPGRNLWVAVTERGVPRLRIYLRPLAGSSDQCELLWIEDRFS